MPIDRLYASIARNPDRLAIANSMTYGELGSAVDALAAALQDLDDEPGSRVGICAWNTTEHLIALLATYAAGKVWVPLSPRNGRAELDAMISATAPTILIADASCIDRFSATGVPMLVAKGGRGEDSVRGLAEARAGDTPRRVERGPEDAQVIKFSGGSTGVPKPVVQSARCIEAQADGLRDFFEFTADDVNLIAAPLTHGASCFVLPILEVGGQHVLLEEAKGPAVLEAIAAYGVTTMYAPPTLLYSMLEAATPRHDLKSLRHLIYSAAPMSPERIRECQRAFGPVIETAYGQVEAPQIVTAMRASELASDENLLSVGRPSSVAKVEVMDPAGQIVGRGEVGEIVVAGPLLMSGYLDRPDATAAEMTNGWLRTGDVGLIDDRGYLFIKGRLRELINTGGFKVFPGEVEASLGKHPAVVECAVFGVEDPKWGEAVHAAVVLGSGSNIGSDDLIAFVKADLGSVKAPKVVHIVDRLERNAAGKVSRAAVRGAVIPKRGLRG